MLLNLLAAQHLQKALPSTCNMSAQPSWGTSSSTLWSRAADSSLGAAGGWQKSQLPTEILFPAAVRHPDVPWRLPRNDSMIPELVPRKSQKQNPETAVFGGCTQKFKWELLEKTDAIDFHAEVHIDFIEELSFRIKDTKKPDVTNKHTYFTAAPIPSTLEGFFFSPNYLRQNLKKCRYTGREKSGS